MRIIAGKHRSVTLASVGKGDAAGHLRPTTDRVRESLFNVLMHHLPFDGVCVLDLFAGTGALGLEALSRGAQHATFVDQGRVSQRLLRENIAKLRVTDYTDVIARDARRLPPCPADACGLVFLDPPYGKNLGAAALQSADTGGWVAPGALIVWEENSVVAPPLGYENVDVRRYGDTYITLLLKTGP